MKWTEPIYLLLLLAVPVVAGLTLASERYGRRLRHVWGGQPDAWSWRSRLRIGLVCLVFVALALALTGAAIQIHAPADLHDRLTLAIGLDVSKSMLAEDVPPNPQAEPIANRLNRGRTFIGELLNQLEGERIALFFFARSGIEVVPPTRDHGFVRYILRHTDMSRLTDSGSDLLAAVTTAETLLSGDGHGVEAIVLISDGEDTENSFDELVRARAVAQGRRTPVHTVRIGGDEPVSIPIRKPGIPGIDGFYTDEQGLFLQTQASDTLLNQLALSSGGESWHYQRPQQNTAAQVVQQILSQAHHEAVVSVSTLSWFQLSSLFLLLALIGYALYTAV